MLYFFLSFSIIMLGADIVKNNSYIRTTNQNNQTAHSIKVLYLLKAIPFKDPARRIIYLSLVLQFYDS